VRKFFESDEINRILVAAIVLNVAVIRLYIILWALSPGVVG
jgi:hypothetical protein